MAVTEDLEKARDHNWILEEELARAKELAAIMANMGQGTNKETEPIKQERTHEKAMKKDAEPMASMTPEDERGWKKEIEALKEELVVQAALQEKEKKLRKIAEEEKRRTKKSLQKT